MINLKLGLTDFNLCKIGDLVDLGIWQDNKKHSLGGVFLASGFFYLMKT